MNNKLVSIVAAALLLGGLLSVGPSSAGASPANAGATFFVPVAGCRVVDTRAGAGGKLLAGSARTWQVSGTGAGFESQGGKPGGCGVPASALSVELSVSAAAPTGTGFLRAGPSGGAPPKATVLQFTARGGTTNTGAVALRPDVIHGLAVTGNGAATHVVLDVIGYSASVAEHPAADASIYVPSTGTCRVADTRAAVGGALKVGQPRTLQVLGQSSNFAAQGGRSGGCYVPYNATAVMATVSAVSPSGTGFLRTWAADAPRPIATVAQFTKGASTSNTATLRVTPQLVENLTIETFGTAVHVVIDIQGYEAPPPRNLLAGASVYVPMAPCRVADTRSGGGRLAAGARRSILVAGSGGSFGSQGGTANGCGVPSAATAVTASISAVDPTGSGLVRTGIYGQQQQSTVLQYQARTGTTNTGAVTLTDRHVDLEATTGGPHVVVDVSGYYLPQPTPYIGGTTRLTNASSDSTAPKISADGRYVAYLTLVVNSTPSTGGHNEVWVLDRTTSARTRISSTMSDANHPSISADGRYVTYASSDSPLAQGDTNGVSDVFVWDRIAGTTARIYASTNGASNPSVSGDGGVVTFQSDDDTAPASPSNVGRAGIFVWERAPGTATRISPLTADASESTISGDGRHVAYSLDTLPNESDIFSWDRTTGATTRVSAGNGWSLYPVLSTDGRYIAFETNATNLVAGDDAYSEGVIVWDRTTATSTRVGAFRSRQDRLAISGDGRFVTYLVTLPALDEYNPDNQETELAVWDRAIDTTFRITAGIGGSASPPSITADGKLIAFHSDAANLVAGDTNERRDVFLWDREG